MFYLIRHAQNDLLPHTIAGRKPGIHLNSTGRKQAERLAEQLSNRNIGHILSSPLERACETHHASHQRIPRVFFVNDLLSCHLYILPGLTG